jgi:hypothetical protein
LGACTGFTYAECVEFDLAKQNNDKPPADYASPLFVYYDERELEGDVNDDNGSSMATGVKALVTSGACRESYWPYSDNGIQFKIKPSAAAYADAKNYLDLDTNAVNVSQVNVDIVSIKTELAAKNVLAHGRLLWQSYQDVGADGLVPTPASYEQVIGGHAQSIWGYDDSMQAFIVRNHWGTSWGASGYCYIKYSDFIAAAAQPELYLVQRVGAVSPPPPPHVAPVVVPPVTPTPSPTKPTKAQLDLAFQSILVELTNINSTPVSFPYITNFRLQVNKIRSDLTGLRANVDAALS